MRIILATGNMGKLAEFRQLFEGTSIEIIPQSDFNVPEAAETGTTFVENALIKARNAAHYTDMPVIADDSGLEVDVLNGAPGIFSARFSGEGANAKRNMDKLLSVLTDVPFEKRTARFRCVLVFIQNEQDESPVVCEGVWEGKILLEPKGENGFGYDPIFYVPTDDCSAAELSASRKIELSHRGQAMRQLLKCMEESDAT